jgi:hypothetical protein
MAKKDNVGKIKVYAVSFQWKTYGDNSVGAKSATINVQAEDKFKATAIAWDAARKLDPSEPERFDVDTNYVDPE